MKFCRRETANRCGVSLRHESSRRVMVLVVSCLAMVPIPCPAFADPSSLTGQVIDSDGKPVESAHVWVIGGDFFSPQVVAETKTDTRGQFAIPVLGNPSSMAQQADPALLARDPSGRVGWLARTRRNGSHSIKISLVPSVEARGRLTDQDGRPVPGADIVPYVFGRSGEPNSRADYVKLTEKLGLEYSVKTGADGSFVLRGVPRGARVSANVNATGLGSPRIGWVVTEPVAVVLDRRVGQIRGRLVPPAGAALSGGLELSIRRTTPPGEHPGGNFELFYYTPFTTAGDGTFHLKELPPGRYDITPSFEGSVPFHAEPLTAIEIAPGAEVAGLELPLQRRPVVSGRILDAVTGRGVEGIRVTAYHVKDLSLIYDAVAKTDAEGRYRVRVQAGSVMICPGEVPKAYSGVLRSECPQIKVETDRDWPDFKLPRAAVIEGVVIDGTGRPVAGAGVFVVVPESRYYGTDPEAVAGPDGVFRLEQLDPDDTIPIRARSGDATTNGAVVIRPREQKGRLTLSVGPEKTARVTGTVTSRAGKPIAGAMVSLWWNRSYASEKTRLSGVGSLLESYVSDASGRFRSGPLWPGDQYKLNVSAPGFRASETASVEGKAGLEHDLGTIALIDTSGLLAGTVIDSAGKPVVGVEVFNRGDCQETATSRTDEKGRFSLTGLFAGGRYVFARKPGFRFTTLRAESDSDKLTFRLLRDDEPPPAWKPLAPASHEEQLELARHVLTKLWDRYGKEANRNGAFVCVLKMAPIDTPLALEWSAQYGKRYDDRILEAAAEQVADDDPVGALGLLTQKPGRSGQYTLQQIAERFAAKDPEKALPFAEEAAVRARALDQPDRARALALAGSVLARIGREAAGRKLIDEAAEAASKMGVAGRQDYTRGGVAGALAPFDLPRALALVEPIKDPSSRERYLAFIAKAISGIEPERALALADQMSRNTSTPHTLRTEIAYRMAATRPDEAIKIVEGMTGRSFLKHQAEAFGWLAVAVAPRDKKRAIALIDRALAMPLDQPQEFASYTYFGGATASAAWIADCARRAGYPDMESVVGRVLATRGSGGRHGGEMQIGADTIAATAFADIDPGAARQMLKDIEARSGLDAAGIGRVARDRWLSAWALVDPKHAETLFEAELAELQGQKEVNLQGTGFFKMAETLAVPPSRRHEFLRGQIGANWWPGFEY